MTGATALDRLDFARRVAVRFGLAAELGTVKTADEKVLAQLPLLSGLDAGRATALARAKRLPIVVALDRFRARCLARR